MIDGHFSASGVTGGPGGVQDGHVRQNAAPGVSMQSSMTGSVEFMGAI